MKITDIESTPIRSVPGYENGIDFKKISTAMPYMYTDAPEWIKFIADTCIVDQIIDWFGTDVRLANTDDPDKVTVELKASPYAMKYWAMQYIGHVEIIQPGSLRTRMKEVLENGLKKYK